MQNIRISNMSYLPISRDVLIIFVVVFVVVVVDVFVVGGVVIVVVISDFVGFIVAEVKDTAVINFLI